VAILPLALFVGLQWPTARFTSQWWHARSKRVESFVRQAVSVKQEYPDRVMLLAGIDDPLYLGAVRDRALPALGVENGYLEPESARAQLLGAHPDCTKYMLDPAAVRKLAREDKLLVLEWREETLIDITADYRGRLDSAAKWARIVDVGSPWHADALGPTWHILEGDRRWMPKRATVRLGGPVKAGEVLRIKGFCPAAQVREGPLGASVEAGGRVLGRVAQARAGDFEWVFELPPALVGQNPLEVAIELERTFRDPPDIRDLGLSFGIFEIR
jgi:hypothetical protein